MKLSSIHIPLLHQLCFLLYAVVGIGTIILFDGTGDAGDSITHYLIARSAPAHPMAFFDHWGKPLFTLLAAPWAQLGITGIKVFNLCCMIGAAFLAYGIARIFHLANAWLVPILFLCAPRVFSLTFSGLTEPLSALVLSAAMLLYVEKRLIGSAILVSLLPFVRSEGLLLMGVFAVVYAAHREWKPILALGFGHVAYSLAGFAAGKPLLWIFTEIPYASTTSPYGNGSLFDFPAKLFMVLGLPILILFLLGLMVEVVRYFIDNKENRPWIVLAIGSFAAVFLFHTLAWHFGMFNAMGLKRVMITVMPAMALIAIVGFNFLTEHTLIPDGMLRNGWKFAIVAVILAFPFTANQAAVDPDRDLRLGPDQVIARQAADAAKLVALPHTRYFTSYNYMSVVLDIDYLDPTKRIELCEDHLHELRKGDIVIYDNWAAASCGQVPFEVLVSDPRLKMLGTYSVFDHNNRELTIIVFHYV